MHRCRTLSMGHGWDAALKAKGKVSQVKVGVR